MREMKRIWNETLTLLALCFLIAYSYPAFNATISESTNHYLGLVQLVCWFAFALDLIYGIWKAENKKEYLKRHPLEIASVLLPFLRPLRLMRVISFGSLALQKIAIGRQFAITVKVAVSALFFPILQQFR